jgi:putative membrane protein
MMKFVANFLVFMVSILHFWFLILEMFLWEKPLGLKTFKNTPEKAKTMAVLAGNQGLYNGFLAVGLLVSLFFSDLQLKLGFQTYFLLCVLTAGVYGAWTVSRRILWIQALPAAVALLAVLATDYQ